MVAKPIFQLFHHGHVTSKVPVEKKGKRKEVEFIWGTEQEKEMEKLKTALSLALASESPQLGIIFFSHFCKLLSLGPVSN